MGKQKGPWRGDIWALVALTNVNPAIGFSGR